MTPDPCACVRVVATSREAFGLGRSLPPDRRASSACHTNRARSQQCAPESLILGAGRDTEEPEVEVFVVRMVPGVRCLRRTGRVVGRC